MICPCIIADSLSTDEFTAPDEKNKISLDSKNMNKYDCDEKGDGNNNTKYNRTCKDHQSNKCSRFIIKPRDTEIYQTENQHFIKGGYPKSLPKSNTKLITFMEISNPVIRDAEFDIEIG